MITSLFDFCRVPYWHGYLRKLEDMIIPENWTTRETSKNWRNPVLESYITHTAIRLYDLIKSRPQEEERWLKNNNSLLVFNTGLYTPMYERVFAVMHFDKQNDGLLWTMDGYFHENEKQLVNFPGLPEKAVYFEQENELIFNANLDIRANLSHILLDERNVERIPAKLRSASNLQTLLEGAIQVTRKQIAYDYKIAIPSYYTALKTMQFLLPLYLQSDDAPDLALAVSKQDDYYFGRTCLTLDMAYCNARLLSPPYGWLARLV